MDISIFLAQAFGIFFVIVGSSLIIHPALMRSMMNMFIESRVTIAVSGYITLLVGIPLVLIHNIWDGTWRIIITVIVWSIFLKGVVRTVAPDTVSRWGQRIACQPVLMRTLLWSIIVAGSCLLYLGFGMNR